MKSWLITWYGITDLRAAQSLEGERALCCLRCWRRHIPTF